MFFLFVLRVLLWLVVSAFLSGLKIRVVYSFFTYFYYYLFIIFVVILFIFGLP